MMMFYIRDIKVQPIVSQLMALLGSILNTCRTWEYVGWGQEAAFKKATKDEEQVGWIRKNATLGSPEDGRAVQAKE